MRETAQVKAARLLAEGRVDIVLRDRQKVDAIVRGDSAVQYRVRHSANVGWQCSCESAQYRPSCSHIKAVSLVTLIHREKP